MINILTQNITYLDPASLTAAGVSGAGRSSACFDECISSSWSSPLEGVELLFSVLGQFPVLDLRKTRIVSPEKLKKFWRLMQKVYFSFHRHHAKLDSYQKHLPLAFVVTFPCASSLFVTIAPPGWPDEEDFLLATENRQKNCNLVAIIYMNYYDEYNIYIMIIANFIDKP